MNTVALNGIEVAYEDHGSGGDVVLLVHGHPFDKSMWLPQVEPIVRLGWRVLIPDLRGYGNSSATGRKTMLGTFAHDLAALLDHLGIEKAVIGGLSMGGQIAMEFCRLFPQRVTGLILVATLPQAESIDGKSLRLATAERLEKEGMTRYAEEVLPKMLAPGTIETNPALAERVSAMMRGTHPVGAAAALRGRAERPDYRDVLANIEAPALVAVGDEDAFTTRADAECMHSLLKGSFLLWLRGVGHMPNLEQPAIFNKALEQYLRGLPAAGRAYQTKHQFCHTVLVTGATSGFGAAIASHYAESGVRVIAVGRRRERLTPLQERFGAERVHVAETDVCDSRSIERLFSTLPEEFQAIDCLVNNAGLAVGLNDAHQASVSDWDRMIDTNCRGLVHMTRAVLPAMVSRGRGHIVNIGSAAGTYPYRGGNVYGATKAFVHQFSLNLRSDLHGTGVRVTCIEPGICGGTEFSNIRFNGDTSRVAAVYQGMQPLTAEDIAKAVAWVVSRPEHVNINTMELMPIAQSCAPFQIHRI